MVDINKKFVRVTNIRNEKYVEFDFAINDPEIFVELILPTEMFHTFCKNNEVETLPPPDEVQEVYDRMLWRVGNARTKVFK